MTDGVTAEQINDAYRQAAMNCHPDRGGNSDDMARLNWARDAGMEACQ
jgi:curved DNA-binding protein CbpA